jgi:hypothetical protein
MIKALLRAGFFPCSEVPRDGNKQPLRPGRRSFAVLGAGSGAVGWVSESKAAPKESRAVILMRIVENVRSSGRTTSPTTGSMER